VLDVAIVATFPVSQVAFFYVEVDGSWSNAKQSMFWKITFFMIIVIDSDDKTTKRCTLGIVV